MAVVLVCLGGAGPAAPENAGPASRAEVFRHATAAAALGKLLFFDPSLSASGQQSCASCHQPAFAFASADAAPVQRGGPTMQLAGFRAVPSLMYLQAVPPFTEHFHDSDDEGDESVDAGPTGGLTWDGRVDQGRDQARIPLLSPFEMANETPAALVARVEAGPHADAIRAVFGPRIFDDEATAFEAIVEALADMQQDAATFYPYSSRYDDFLAGRGKLTDQETRGLAAFNDEARGNCASCHISAPGRDGSPPHFSDYGLIALGVPRNEAIPRNQDPSFHDLGLCGPERTDFRDRSEYCGLFRTPTLRNVATRRVFFHNGAIGSLREAVAFYATRDTDPQHWYSRNPDGAVRKFDDLPERFHGNVNAEPPFGGRPGDKPALGERDIDDIVAFLGTLTDRSVRQVSSPDEAAPAAHMPAAESRTP